MVQTLCESDAPDWSQEDNNDQRRRHIPDQIIRKFAEGNKFLAGAPNSTRSAGISRSPSRPGTAGWPNTAA